MKRFLILLAVFLAAFLAWRMRPDDNAQLTIYPARAVITMADNDSANAVAVHNGNIEIAGDFDELKRALPSARTDETFADKYILPGFIDPHVHMLLAAVQYSLPMAPPWPIATADGVVEGLPDRASFLNRVAEIVADEKGKGPLIIYGYHDLIHGALDRHDLDAITTKRPLVIWHYSSHDFYLNTAALTWAKIDASLHETFKGVPLGPDGEPSGRIYEDAAPYLYREIAGTLLNPLKIRRGANDFSHLLRQGGVTTVADLGYGIIGLGIENLNIRLSWRSPQHAGYRLFLVPENRAFVRAFGDKRVDRILDLVATRRGAPAPVLPQVKFFTDAAFFSQTMRIGPPGYLTGQTRGEQGLWVLQPDEIASTIQPYWDAGLDVHIHSNGDEAQAATLAALKTLRETNKKLRFVIEHAGLVSPDEVTAAAKSGAAISAASHYVYFLGESYKAPLGATRSEWITPLASLSEAGVRVALHSDAPLAPPLPLRAASVHLTRATYEGGTLTPSEKLFPKEALEAITIDAAYSLGLEDEIGSIAPGKRADFTILEANPLETAGEDWGDIPIWGVVLNGRKRPLRQQR